MDSKDLKDLGDGKWRKMIAKMMLKTDRSQTLGTYICEGLVILEQMKQKDRETKNESNT